MSKYIATMAGMPEQQTSLRERKKSRTRQAIGEAALRLAVEHGMDAVTSAMVAESADVSRRTLGNYFSNKEEAIVALVFSRSRDVCAALSERPGREPLWEAIANAADTQIPPADRVDEWVQWVRLIRDTPALNAAHLKAYADLEDALATVIGNRVGRDPQRDPFPRLAACATTAAFRGSLRFWLDSLDGGFDPGDYRALVRAAVRDVVGGLGVD